jgi:hypothetical protein
VVLLSFKKKPPINKKLVLFKNATSKPILFKGMGLLVDGLYALFTSKSSRIRPLSKYEFKIPTNSPPKVMIFEKPPFLN